MLKTAKCLIHKSCH